MKETPPMSTKMNWQQLLSTQRFRPKDGEIMPTSTPSTQEGADALRTDFHIDYDRVVFSGAFRRLGRTTQVHPFAEPDHTHISRHVSASRRRHPKSVRRRRSAARSRGLASPAGLKWARHDHVDAAPEEPRPGARCTRSAKAASAGSDWRPALVRRPCQRLRWSLVACGAGGRVGWSGRVWVPW